MSKKYSKEKKQEVITARKQGATLKEISFSFTNHSFDFASPEIIHAIIAGTLKKDIGIEQLKQAMPLMWDEQKKMFGME